MENLTPETLDIDYLLMMKERMNEIKAQYSGLITNAIEKIRDFVRETYKICVQSIERSSKLEKKFENITKYDEEIRVTVGKMMKISEEIKRGSFMEEKQRFLDLEGMFDDLEFLFGKYRRTNGDFDSLQKWKRRYDNCRKKYDIIRSSLVKEENYSHSQEVFLDQVKRLFFFMEDLKNFPLYFY